MEDYAEHNEHNTESDEDLIDSAIHEVIGNRTIEDLLNILTDKLDDYTEENHGERNSQETIGEFFQAIVEGRINKSTIADCYFEAFFSSNLETKEVRLIQLTFIYTAAAQVALANHRIMKSWHAIAEAQKYWAYYSGLNDPAKRNRIERARKGGIQKAKNASLLKQAFIMLLNEKKPRRGWRTPQDAASSLVDELMKIADKEGIPITSDKKDLMHSLINLIYDEKEVREAFKLK